MDLGQHLELGQKNKENISIMQLSFHNHINYQTKSKKHI